jgi:hypothetical protein
VRGKLHQISTTGGLLNVEAPLDEKLQVELIFPSWGDHDPRKGGDDVPHVGHARMVAAFPFRRLPEANKNVLETPLKAFVQQRRS